MGCHTSVANSNALTRKPGYAKREPRSAVWPENMRSPNARDDARLLRAAADKLEALAGDGDDGDSAA